MAKPDHHRVKGLLAEAIRMLCKNSLAFESELCVEGLLGITLDNKEVFLVNIKENVQETSSNMMAADYTDVRPTKLVQNIAQNSSTSQPLESNRNKRPRSSQSPNVHPLDFRSPDLNLNSGQTPTATSLSTLPGSRSDESPSIPIVQKEGGGPPAKRRLEEPPENKADELLRKENIKQELDMVDNDKKPSEVKENENVDSSTDPLTNAVLDSETGNVPSLDFDEMLVSGFDGDRDDRGHPGNSEDPEEDGASVYGADMGFEGEQEEDSDDDVVVVKEERADFDTSQQQALQELYGHGQDDYLQQDLNQAQIISHQDFVSALNQGIVDQQHQPGPSGFDPLDSPSTSMSRMPQHTTPSKRGRRGRGSQSSPSLSNTTRSPGGSAGASNQVVLAAQSTNLWKQWECSVSEARSKVPVTRRVWAAVLNRKSPITYPSNIQRHVFHIPASVVKQALLNMEKAGFGWYYERGQGGVRKDTFFRPSPASLTPDNPVLMECGFPLDVYTAHFSDVSKLKRVDLQEIALKHPQKDDPCVSGFKTMSTYRYGQ